MGDLVLHSEVRLPASPVEVFGLFGSGDPALGWLFGAEAAALAPGALVRLVVPLGGAAGVDGTARILSLRPCRRIDLINETPWVGRVVCRFEATAGGGTRILVRISMDHREVLRLGGDLGLVRTAEARRGELPVGLLTSLSGSAGLLGRSTVNCAELAVEEINADGGVLGNPVRLVVADDATDPLIGGLAMERLLRTPRLSAVVGMHSSATLAATSPLALARGVPYLYTPTSEPSSQPHPLLVRFGETPVDQLHRALPRLAAETGGRSWFFVGNDYSWPRAIGDTARVIVERLGGRVAGEGYLPVGARAFGPLLEAIGRSGTDHVISSFIGQDHVRFERDFVSYGLRSGTRTFAPLMDDAVVEHLGSDAAGIWNVLGYFESLDTSRNREFLARYASRFGACSAPVSAAAEGVYEVLHRWARACILARGTDPMALLDGLRRVTFDGPRLSGVGTDAGRLLLGEATPGGFRVLDEMPGARRIS